MVKLSVLTGAALSALIWLAGECMRSRRACWQLEDSTRPLGREGRALLKELERRR